jgi:hypothetical protein
MGKGFDVEGNAQKRDRCRDYKTCKKEQKLINATLISAAIIGSGTSVTIGISYHCNCHVRS